MPRVAMARRPGGPYCGSAKGGAGDQDLAAGRSEFAAELADAVRRVGLIRRRALAEFGYDSFNQQLGVPPETYRRTFQ
jgi:hypothetical protein